MHKKRKTSTVISLVLNVTNGYVVATHDEAINKCVNVH